MAKVVINGEAFDYEGGKQPMSEALWIEHVYKRRYAEWQTDLQAGSAKAMCLLACLIWRRDGRNVDTAYQDLLDGKTDFDLNEMMQSMIDSVTAAQEEAAAPDPTPPPDPDGTPGTATDTSSSSPASSASARGKSGSSTSRTSKRS